MRKLPILSLEESVDALKVSRAVIAYPTDTIWGLGCQAEDREAINRLFMIKKRQLRKGLIVLVDSLLRLQDWIVPLSDAQVELVNTQQQPTTFLIPASSHCPTWLTGDHATLAIRVVRFVPLYKVVQALEQPLVSTSANISGERILCSRDEIIQTFHGAIDGVMEGECGGTAPSKIIDLFSARVLRE